MAYEAKPFLPKNNPRLSERTLQIHHDKLYVGYINKANEIGEKLREFAKGTKQLDTANQTYSELRGLKEGETFAKNGVYLHEWYFEMLGGDGTASGSLAEALAEQYGSLEQFKAYFKANGMVARGWAILAWDTKVGGLRIYTGDAHNQGGVWGALPIIVLDVYEHAYFIDYGSDRGKYIDDFLAGLDWEKTEAIYQKVQSIKFE